VKSDELFEFSTHAADFGLSAKLTESQKYRTSTVGTQYWMAPVC
jgi:hypothetical protein